MMKLFLMSLIAMMLLNAVATEYFVDYTSGKKGNPGTREQPFPNFDAVRGKLKAGDRVTILPSKKPIRDTLRIGELKGTKEKPIVIDGMNNTFVGSMPLNPKDWKEVSPGLFSRERQVSTNMIYRYFMIHKGHGVFMGRSTKVRKNPPLKKKEELQPGEWTLVDLEKGKKSPKHLVVFYLRLAEGEKTPQEGQWEEPAKISGVAISSYCTKKECGHDRCGKECQHAHCDHVQIRNMTMRHFWNDGYNIHGKVRNLLFEHIAAIECGDDGFSAHEACEVTVKHLLALRNSTGICHVQQAVCHHDQVYIEGTRGWDFYPCNQSSHTLTNAYIIGNSREGISLNIKTPATVAMKNCLILNEASSASFTCNEPLQGAFENVRVYGYKNTAKKPGIVIETDAAALRKTIEEKRKEFFTSFNLEQKL